MKRCSQCKELKHESDFHKRNLSKDGLAAMCKVCKTAFEREKYQNDPVWRAEKIRKVVNARRVQNSTESKLRDSASAS